MGEKAEFRVRGSCIVCDAQVLSALDGGRFDEEPHLSMLRNSPWGQSPLPYLEGKSWELVTCGRCGMVFHKRLLTAEWDARRFSEWMTETAIAKFEQAHGADSPAARFSHARHDLDRLLCIEKLTRHLRGEESLRILDFGCGWGRFVALGTSLGFDAYGVDRSTARLERSQSMGRVFPSLEAYQEAVGKPPHAVTLFEVLEHLDDPKQALAKLAEVMVPGGILVAEVPDCRGLSELRSLRDLALADGLDHVNAFTPQTLTSLARNAGFERVRAPTAQVSADFFRIAKREVRRALDLVRAPSTQQFFIRR